MKAPPKELALPPLRRPSTSESLVLGAYLGCVPAANWALQHLGDCRPGAPCLLEVLPGLAAPSGVLFVGLALVLRDLVQQSLGVRWALGALVAGTVLSGALAPPGLVLASALAFGLAELADFAVYSPLRRRGLVLAVLASGMVGAVLDSAVFLLVAFGRLDFLAGQVAGKLLLTVLALPLVAWLHRGSRGQSLGPRGRR